jgi:hypothetical protein
MSDVSITMDVLGHDKVMSGFEGVKIAGEKLKESFKELGTKLAETYLSYEGLVKIAEQFKGAIEMGGKLADLSEQTGISAGKLVVLQRAFENSGMSADEVGKSVNKMQKFLVEAGQEGSEAATKLSKIGLTTQQLKGMNPDQLFETLGKQIASIKDPSERATASMMVFNKTGGRFLSLFAHMDETMEKSKNQIGSLADIMERSAENFHEVEIGFNAIGKKGQEFAAGVLDKIIPSVKQFTDSLSGIDAAKFGQKLGEGINDFINLIRGMVNSDWKESVKLMWDVFSAFYKSEADGFVDSMTTAFSFIGKLFSELFSNGALGNIGTLLKDSLIIATLEVESFILGVWQKVFAFFSGLSMETFINAGKFLGDKFMEVINWVGEQLKEAFTHPLDYVSKVFSSVMGSEIGKTATQFEEEYNKAHGNIIDKQKAGVDSVIAKYKGEFGDTLTKLGDVIPDAMKSAVDSSKVIHNNFFNSAEAIKKAAEDAKKLKEKGEKSAPKEDHKTTEPSNAGFSGGGGGGASNDGKPIYEIKGFDTGVFKNVDGMSSRTMEALDTLNRKIQSDSIIANENRLIDVNMKGGGAGAATALEKVRNSRINSIALSGMETIANSPNTPESDRIKLRENINKTRGKIEEGGMGSSTGDDKKQADPLKEIFELVKKYLPTIDEKLPIHALT